MTRHHTQQDALYAELVAAVRQLDLTETDRQWLWWLAGHGPELAATGVSLLERAALSMRPQVPAPRHAAPSDCTTAVQQAAWRRWREGVAQTVPHEPKHAAPTPAEASQWRDLKAGVRAWAERHQDGETDA
ncbi:hypothetical protein [Streptomonospora litoralis]|uniref:Uncharacterized protein n=1 Tax=Streptomonospora litoralis TaxID=2498135 RepID=A0A4P6QB40_9ACTN|nr:hypothetical protein [Streptomonospora litoralis]QBI56879.1 hypothetical protein EKD16_25695 [Streptomonospora litoralis]